MCVVLFCANALCVGGGLPFFVLQAPPLPLRQLLPLARCWCKEARRRRTGWEEQQQQQESSSWRSSCRRRSKSRVWGGRVCVLCFFLC